MTHGDKKNLQVFLVLFLATMGKQNGRSVWNRLEMPSDNFVCRIQYNGTALLLYFGDRILHVECKKNVFQAKMELSGYHGSNFHILNMRHWFQHFGQIINILNLEVGNANSSQNQISSKSYPFTCVLGYSSIKSIYT